MNLNKNFIEVFDIFTNDYKIVERTSAEKKNPRKGFLFGNMSSFFRRDRANQIHNEGLSNTENHNFMDERAEATLLEQETMPEQEMQESVPNHSVDKSKQVPKSKNEMQNDSFQSEEPIQQIDEPERSDQIKRVERPKVQREEPASNAPIFQPMPPSGFPTTPVAPTMPVPTIQPVPTQPSFAPIPPFSPTQPTAPTQPPFAPVQPPFAPSPLPTQPRPPFQPAPRPPFQPAPRPPMFPPASNRAISLLTELYYNLGNLQILYLQLATYAPDINSANQLNTYANEVFILRQTVLEIYRTLTGRTLPPTSNRYLIPVLTGNYCTDLGTVYGFASSISALILQLLRIIDINTINRQLTIILATINNQLIGLNNLMNVCV